MNHKWTKNQSPQICEKCGVQRTKKEFKRFQRSETVLSTGFALKKAALQMLLQCDTVHCRFLLMQC